HMECMTAGGSLCPGITALGCLTLAKAPWHRLRPPCSAFSGLAPPLPAETGFRQMRATKSTSVGYYTDSTCRIPTQMYTIPSWLEGSARTDNAFLGSQRVEGTAARERTSSSDPQASGKSQTIIV